MKRAIVYLAVLGALCTGLGIAVGVVIEKKYTSGHLPEIMRAHFLKQHGKRDLLGKKTGIDLTERLKGKSKGILERIDRELNLSSEQKDKIKDILEESKREARQAKDKFKTYLAQLREKSNAKISEILTPEQKEKFEKLMAKIGRWQRKIRKQQRE